MTLPRRTTAGIAKTLNGVAAPVYVFDSQRTLVFCNAAAEAWCGTSADELIGLTANFHSSPTASPAEQIAALLCPCPEAFAGQQVTGHVTARDEAGQLLRRRATFVPLAGDDGTWGVLVVAATENLAGDDHGGNGAAPTIVSGVDDPTADQLHAQLQQLHADWLARNRLDRICGDSPAMRRARALAAVAAGCTASVLIVGPARDR